ncbi:preprotein translocase subunit YajC [Bavariicoccus seileri]|uniref:preprotein translocase subunit YajC n=1 Tax=Bavariicoccus seileri TaxID=549685 RepID=UPI003F930A79
MDSNILITILMYGGIFFVFYWFVIRKQKKRATEARDMLSSMGVGDKVMTIGGLHGVIDEVNEKTVVLDCEGIFLTFERNAIRQIVEKASLTPTEDDNNETNTLTEDDVEADVEEVVEPVEGSGDESALQDDSHERD